MKHYLGVDVGSLTCKFVLIDENEKVLFSLYKRTEGNPINAIKNALKELKSFCEKEGIFPNISAVGTTGSARHLAAAILGADLIKNEVTAHAQGALHFLPDVRTIIEIGGQDSKIIILENGQVVDFAMNLLCLLDEAKVIGEDYYLKSIKDVQKGEMVLTHLGRFKPVEEIFERDYQGEVIEIFISKSHSLRLTPEHPVLALKYQEIDKKNNSPKPVFLPANNLTNRDFVCLPLSIKDKIKDQSIFLDENLKFEPLSNKNKEKGFVFDQWFFAPIKKINQFFYEGKVYNLKVKEDDSFVANYIAVHNCSAGTGAFLDAQAFRLGVNVKDFGQIALRSKNPTSIASRCSVFAESDMIHKQQIGHSIEDIVAGLCLGLARNYLASLAKGKKIEEPVIFLGGVSENIGMRWAFEKLLNKKIVVPPYNTVMGALGVALLAKKLNLDKSKFRGFDLSDMRIECKSFTCKGCPNECEVICAEIEGQVVARWGDRCGKWSGQTI